MAVLAVAAGLTDVAAFGLRRLADGLAISNLRRADGRLDLELTQQTVNDDLQMELAHAGDDRLAGLLVGVGLEGRILFSQTQQAENHLLLTSLGLRLDGDLNNRLRELHLLKDDLVLVVAQGVAGRGVTKPTTPQISPV